MNTIRTLHIASFKGNIGDNANHSGFRRLLAKNTGLKFEYTEYEIRNVYRGDSAFDEEFVNIANEHDLVVVGGGNYFELWVDRSKTGCSFDIDLELLKAIKKPVIFNALGVDPAQGASDLALNKFRNFLDVVIGNPNMLLSCRNDGSLEALENIVGKSYADEFFHIPDAGFFTEVSNYHHPEFEGENNVVIQLAGDMKEIRFPSTEEYPVAYLEFLEGMRDVIVELTMKGMNIVLVPHIFRDLGTIGELLDILPDKIRRESVKVAPYLIGDCGQSYIFDIYKKSKLVLAMRFHANVCALGLGVPCIPLINYRQIDKLYDELNLQEFKVEVNKKGFKENLDKLILYVLSNDFKIQQDFLFPWIEKINSFHREIAKLIERGNK